MSVDVRASSSIRGRSRKGAWIEILTVLALRKTAKGRSRKGAWIEITPDRSNIIHDYHEDGRSRKGAWIEIN